MIRFNFNKLRLTGRLFHGRSIGFFIGMIACFCAMGQEIHEIKKGETLYSISKKYGRSVEEISGANPGIEQGLKPGLKIIIPASSPTGNDRPLMHQVLKKQTWYSISKMYGITVEDLRKANAELEERLTIGVQLKIPPVQVTGKVSNHDSIPNQNKEPILEEKGESRFSGFPWSDKPTKKAGDTLKVALLLPLHLELNFEEADSLNPDDFKLHYATHAGLDFYQGLKLACDSIVKTGLNIYLEVFDIKEDSGLYKKGMEAISKGNFDIILGPLQNTMYSLVKGNSEAGKIPLLVPFSFFNPDMQGGKTVAMYPSVKTQARTMGKFIGGKFPKEKIIFIHSGLTREKELMSFFKSGIDTSFAYTVFTFPKQPFAEVKKFLALKRGCAIIFCSSNEATVNQFVTSLHAIKDSTLTLVGMPTWEHFPSLDFQILDGLNFHSFSTLNPLDTSSNYISFVKVYREAYQTDPSIQAMQGYDAGLIFLADFFKGSGPLNGLTSSFQFKTEGGKAENQQTFLYHLEDLKVVPVKP